MQNLSLDSGASLVKFVPLNHFYFTGFSTQASVLLYSSKYISVVPQIIGLSVGIVLGRDSSVGIVLGRDSSVGLATRYGLGDPGIESRWGRGFPHSSRPALGPTRPPIKWVPGLYRGVKRPGRGVDHLPHLARRFKKE